jgi:AcrR family transcriptional regulator
MSETQRPKRTQADRTYKRKERVIREATRLFGTYGFRGARLIDIAKAAELSEPGLLHHFPSKEHLLMGVLEARDQADRERFGPALREERGKVLDALQALVEHNETVPGLVRLFTVLVTESITPEHPGHDFFVRRYQTLREQFIPLLKQAQDQGEIRSDVSAEDLAVMVFALMDGLQVQWLLDPENVQMAQVFRGFVLLLRSR